MKLSGCCITRYGTVPAVLPTKADRIMARYRPIAPKPATIAVPPSLPPSLSDASSSIVSFEVPFGKQVPQTGRSRRSRKRKGDAILSPRGMKRPSMVVAKWDTKERSNMSNSNACLQADSSLAGRVADSLASGQMFMSKGMQGGETECAISPVSAAVAESARIMEQDAGFMERAAASAPPSVFPDRRANPPRGSGGFVEMIRGITGLSSTADVITLMHQSRASPEATLKPSEDVQFAPEALNSCTELTLAPGGNNVTERLSTELHSAGCAAAAISRSCAESGVVLGATPQPSAVSGFLLHSEAAMERSGTVDSKISAVEIEAKLKHDEEAGVVSSKPLITLCLLPDTSSRADSPPESSVSACSPASDAVRAIGSDHCSSTSRNHSDGFFCDIAYIEQTYGNSNEPVALLDQRENVVWHNRAYDKAMKDAMDRHSELLPFIDPLGIPTMMGRFNIKFRGSGEHSPATLWGFLKMFVLDVEMAQECSPCALSKGLTSYLTTVSRSIGWPSIQGSKVRSNNSVIMPRPLKLVGSTVSLESITEVQSESSTLSDSLEQVKQQLEKESLPAFITDPSNRVKWVNSAYKLMIGQPECPWLISTITESTSSGSLGGSPRLTGEVLLVTNGRVPTLVPAFSGRVNIQWTKLGERKCMTVPCDVARVCCCCSGSMILVWKFDISASLSLTCGAV